MIHLFNPEHDDALAHHTANYLPDKASARLAADLCTLPAWLAKADDTIVVTDAAVAQEWARHEAVEQLLPPLTFAQSIVPDTADTPMPWGWDRAVKRRFERLKLTSLPTDAAINALRDVSHRRTAQALLGRLRADLPDLVGEMSCLTTEASVKTAVEVPFTTLLKAPWSGSGRGLRRGFGSFVPPLTGWVANLLDRQGAVMVEPFYHRLRDFAMEFYLTPSECRYLGLSLFSTTGIGGYAGNIVASDEALLADISRGLPTDLLPKLKDLLLFHLPALVGSRYTGFVGIDMMTVMTDDGTTAVHPCVEINFRRTMGHVSVALAQYVCADRRAEFRLLYAKTPQLLTQEVSMLNTDTAVVRDRKLYAGYLPLTPLTADSRFHACLYVPDQD